MKAIKLGIVMDPIESIKKEKDSTLAIMQEAQARGWSLAYLTIDDLYILNGRAMGQVRYLTIKEGDHDWYELTEPEALPLESLDALLMRKDPPFDLQYIMATYILELAEQAGCVVINSPRALRDVNEKAFTAWFPECCPPSLITRSKVAIREFLQEHEKVVIKPMDRMSGRSVFILEEGHGNNNVIIEEVTDHGSKFVNVQSYLPEIKETGDKRILLIGGEPIEQGIARIPAGDDHRGNLAVGAKAEGFLLSKRDRWICDRVGPVLREKGLFFAGIDIIGDYLTEINVTSPTGIREIDRSFGTNIPSLFLDRLSIEFNIMGSR